MLSSLDLAAVNSFLITARKEIDKNKKTLFFWLTKTNKNGIIKKLEY